MMHIPKAVWKLLIVILIGCGGTFMVIGTSLIKSPKAKYDVSDRWQEMICPIHSLEMEKQKVGISYQLMPRTSDRDYLEVPYKEGDFPNADYHYYVGPVLDPDPRDSALVFVCSECTALKLEREQEIITILQKFQSSQDEKVSILQKSLNLRAFQKYYRYPRKRKRIPLVIVKNEIVQEDMKLIKKDKKALILDFEEIHANGRTTYLEFTRFEIRNRNNLDLRLFVSFYYSVENVKVDIEFALKKGKWEIEHYEIKR